MPLPSGGTSWPPPALTPVHDRLAEWSAWYSSDPGQLADFYGGNRANGVGFDNTSRIRNRSSQYRGGWAGRLARWWWGQPIPEGERRTKLHVPIASDIASTSADLLFSEPPTLSVDDPTTQDRLDELVDDGMHATLLEAGEVCAALGGVYLRVVWDREVDPDKAWLDSVHADAAVPEWRWGKLAAVTFWRVLDDDGQRVIRHLERHEPGAILHGLYDGTSDDLGQAIPLTDHPETAPLADVVEDGNVIPTGLPDRLTAVYWPNVRPSRVWRHIPAAARLGRSDYAGVEGFMDALDETYSSWMRDIRLAKARILVPDAYLTNLGPGQGAYWESEREVYAALNMLPTPNGGSAGMITPNQFAIRVDEHQRTAQDLVTQILRTAGYSTQTFGLTGEVAVTATEVTARERRSFISRDKKIVYARPALQEILETLLMIDATVFESKVEPARPNIEFGDSVSDDPASLAQTANLLAQAVAASVETKVRLVHQDWDDDQVREEVERIKEENGIGEPVPDPFALRPPVDLGGPNEEQDQEQEPADEPPTDDEQDGPPSNE